LSRRLDDEEDSEREVVPSKGFPEVEVFEAAYPEAEEFFTGSIDCDNLYAMIEKIKMFPAQTWNFKRYDTKNAEGYSDHVAFCIPPGEGKTTLEKSYPTWFNDGDTLLKSFLDAAEAKPCVEEVERVFQKVFKPGWRQHVADYKRESVSVNLDDYLDWYCHLDFKSQEFVRCLDVSAMSCLNQISAKLVVERLYPAWLRKRKKEFLEDLGFGEISLLWSDVEILFEKVFKSRWYELYSTFRRSPLKVDSVYVSEWISCLSKELQESMKRMGIGTMEDLCRYAAERVLGDKKVLLVDSVAYIPRMLQCYTFLLCKCDASHPHDGSGLVKVVGREKKRKWYGKLWFFSSFSQRNLYVMMLVHLYQHGKYGLRAHYNKLNIEKGIGYDSLGPLSEFG